MLEDVKSIAVCFHSIFKGFIIDFFKNILESLLDVIPCFVEILHMHLQIGKVHLTSCNLECLLLTKFFKVLITHASHFIDESIIKVKKQVFLTMIMLFYCTRTFSLVLSFQFYNFAHECSQLLVSWVICVIGIMWHCLLLFGGSNTINRKSLTGSLCGADSAIVHFFIFDAYYVLCALAPVVFVCTALFPNRRVGSWLSQQGSVAANGANHRLASICYAVR